MVAANPPLRGVHWISGIELGIRLLSWVWIRRLLDGWPGAAALFERRRRVRQIHWHQQWLAAFPSRGSSANNHVIAEAAGQLVAGCAFEWFPPSERWRAEAPRPLERELAATPSRPGSTASWPRSTTASCWSSACAPRPRRPRRAVR